MCCRIWFVWLEIEGWKEFTETTLKEINEREIKSLGGPTNGFMNFDDEDVEANILDNRRFTSYDNDEENKEDV